MSGDAERIIQRQRRARLANRANAGRGVPACVPKRRRTAAVSCPACGRYTLATLDSRQVDAPWGVRRRRACAGCGCRITTYETVAVIDGEYRDEGAGI